MHSRTHVHPLDMLRSTLPIFLEIFGNFLFHCSLTRSTHGINFGHSLLRYFLLTLIDFILKAFQLGPACPVHHVHSQTGLCRPGQPPLPLCCPLSTANNLFPQVENLSHRADCCSGSNELFPQNCAKTFFAQKLE